MPFLCQACGKESPKWLGHCPQCGDWNTFEERPLSRTPTAQGSPQELAGITTEDQPRLALPLKELNRVLGGGIVPGSLVLLSGEPGIGKSTLILQACDLMAEKGGGVVYVSGEESPAQIKLRAQRLGVRGKGLYILAETDLEAIFAHLESLSPRLVAIDSIQTMHSPSLEGAPGSLAQVRECTLKLMSWAKGRAVPILLTGHVTKEGAIAGPKTLEHIVDVVLYLEGEPFSSYRLLRGIKNRFGSTHEVGIFEMQGQGLAEVENPSQAFLSTHPGQVVGSAVVPTLEGSRPLLVEIQALTTPTIFNLPRRLGNGVEFNRLLLIAAVLTQRTELSLGGQDIIVNAVGGFKINEPAADLGIALAIASSFRGVALAPGTVALGEVGLSGELRPVPQLERRLLEAARLGFSRCLAPPISLPSSKEMELVPVANLSQALRLGLLPKRRKDESHSRDGKGLLGGGGGLEHQELPPYPHPPRK